MGFLGLLHLEVFCQRLHQEYGTESILTAPSVTYKIKLKSTKRNIKDGTDIIYINNPAHFPDHITIEESFEPMVIGEFLCIINIIYLLVHFRYNYHTRSIFRSYNVFVYGKTWNSN